MAALASPGVVPLDVLPPHLDTPGPGDGPPGQNARWRAVVVAISIACVSLPLLRPSGPGNTGLVDLALLCAILASVHWASTQAHSLRVPYAVPTALTMAAGAFAVLWVGAPTHAVGTSGLALVQDAFVFGWAAAIATVGQQTRLLDVVIKAFAYGTVGWAAVLILGELTHQTWITGINSRDGLRASLTFGDPNLAADYFVCGLLVLRAAQRPRRRGPRLLCCTLIIVATVLTLSNGGILAMLLATLLGGLFSLAKRRGVVTAATVGLVVAVGAVAVTQTVDIRGWVNRVEQSNTLVRDSLGREAESTGSRSALAQEGTALLLREDLAFGYGPANTESMLRSTGAAYVKEAHDDYLATLLERGVVGGLALILLIVGVAVRARRAARAGDLDPELRAIVPRPELLAAACVAIAFSAAFYEVLHFRHVWAVFGIVAALAQRGSRR
ncbi:MAG TPA: O-antigen ligase family protein [Micromonosporaceae bacterium]|nr:O-antigen ligase family protein [Micromonosporaceae bacterium]